MNVTFTSTSTDGPIPHHPKDSSATSLHHGNQPHLPIASLPSPAEPLCITSFPIKISDEERGYDPKRVANLWLQLLSIQIQNGNFWGYDDVLGAHLESEARSRGTADIRPVDVKLILYIRHKLQKSFLMKERNVPHTPEELRQMDDLVSRLEAVPDIPRDTIKVTKIHKVAKAMLKIEEIPGDDEYGFRLRLQKLLKRWQEIIDNPDVADAIMKDEKAKEDEKENEIMEMIPGVCLTQLTETQCEKLTQAAAMCTPPLSPAVVELMCIMPLFTHLDLIKDYQIIPGANLAQSFDCEDLTKINRGVYHDGPIIPPDMFQLLASYAPGYGTAFFLDTKTGESVELTKYEPQWAGECTEFDGPRASSVEETLQQWVDNFVSLKWVFLGDETISTSMDRSMEYLNHRDLLLEFGWPNSFPLPQPQYHAFLKRKSELWKSFLVNSQKPHLHYVWRQLVENWQNYSNAHEAEIKAKDSSRITETRKAMDEQIFNILRHHVQKTNDRLYAIRADVPMQKSLLGSTSLRPFTHQRGDLKVEITPEMVFDRFIAVVDYWNRAPGDMQPRTQEELDDCLIEIREIIEGSFKSWKLSTQGIYEQEPPGFMDDDDESSDFIPEADNDDDDGSEDFEEVENELEDEDEDGVKFGSDEDEDDELDFDVVLLEEEAKTDVEPLRKALEEFDLKRGE